jgi:alpha-beta hydrolase superfamily lysophospholipase
MTARAGVQPARLDLIQRTRVEQVIDRDRFGQFGKEILRARADSGRALALVRKFRDDVERKGAVLLIHGFAQNRYTWHLSSRSFVNYLADQGLDVYNLELTGHGRSRDYGTAPARTFHEYVVDAASVLEAVAEYSGQERVFVIGHSLGGAVCYALAPRVIDSIAGVITIAGLFKFGSNPMTRRLAEFLEHLSRFDPLLRRVTAGIRTHFLGRVLADWWLHAEDLSWSFPMAGWVPGSTEPHVVQERLVRGFDQTGLNILLTMMRWAAEGNFTGELGEDYAEAFAALDVPLLVIAADRDKLLPPQDARPAYDLSVSRDKTYKIFSPVREEVHWGHLDIILGARAPQYVWPYVGSWIEERS